MIKLSIIIVNYNVCLFLEQCLLSIQAASENLTTEIIVVDNNSSDGSCEMVKNKFPEVLLVENSINVGFGRANNQGVSVANGEYVLIVNPDTVIAEDALLNVVAFADNKKDVGAVGVKLIDGTGNFLPESKRNIPTLKVAIQKIYGNSKNYYASHVEDNKNSKVDILTGAFMLIKRKVYELVGGFDDTYFMYGEDIDLSYKLIKHGFQNYYIGTTTIIHYKGESTVKDIAYHKHFYGAMRIFYKKYFKVILLYNLMLFVGIKLLILIKSISPIKEKNKIKSKGNVLLIGKDQIIFKKIVRQVKPSSSILIEEITTINEDYDTVFFENGFISNKDIIKNFQSVQLKNIAKRIIPRNTSFYIGSDFSTNRGEAIQF